MKKASDDSVKKIIVMLSIFTVIILIYNQTYKAKYGDFLTNFKISDVPDSIKCMFGEDNCEEGDIDGWSICHGLMYFIIGLIAPNYYITITAVSVVFELVQPFLGNSSRYIINPLVNLTGYTIGSIMSKNFGASYKEKYNVIEK